VSDRTRERFERSIREAACVIVERLQRGDGVGLMIGDEIYPPVTSRAQRWRLLRPLAEVELQPQGSVRESA
jgi:uncharacterized protein (DUF58 family)